MHVLNKFAIEYMLIKSVLLFKLQFMETVKPNIYSETSVAQTLMARLPWLFRTRS